MLQNCAQGQNDEEDRIYRMFNECTSVSFQITASRVGVILVTETVVKRVLDSDALIEHTKLPDVNSTLTDDHPLFQNIE